MQSEYPVDDILRYCRQIVLKAMDGIRARMRGSDRLTLAAAVENPDVDKAEQNLTQGVDREAEDLIAASLQRKLFRKIPGLKQFTVFSEEFGIRTFPEGMDESQSPLVVFVDPIDGTEFIATLQGGWSLLSVCDRQSGEPLVAVAGDVFLDRVYWASQGGPAECLDFTTHSWFRLDGGPAPKSTLEKARVNVLTTKVPRFRALARQEKLLEALDAADGRINLSWGSNTIIQVAAGYADVAVEFAKGFATYDVLPGIFIGQRAGLTILDPRTGQELPRALDIPRIFETFRADPKLPLRTPFVAAKDPRLAAAVLELLDLSSPLL
jgi:myo-inositol-1(or 4)-monophosphatase